MIVSIFTQTVLSLTLYAGHSIWGYAFSSEAVVLERLSALLPILAIMVPFDGFNAIASGESLQIIICYLDKAAKEGQL